MRIAWCGARGNADAVLGVAREKADRRFASATRKGVASARVNRARKREDETLRVERASEDHALQRERDEHSGVL